MRLFAIFAMLILFVPVSFAKERIDPDQELYEALQVRESSPNPRAIPSTLQKRVGGLSCLKVATPQSGSWSRYECQIEEGPTPDYKAIYEALGVKETVDSRAGDSVRRLTKSAGGFFCSYEVSVHRGSQPRYFCTWMRTGLLFEDERPRPVGGHAVSDQRRKVVDADQPALGTPASTRNRPVGASGMKSSEAQ